MGKNPLVVTAPPSDTSGCFPLQVKFTLPNITGTLPGNETISWNFGDQTAVVNNQNDTITHLFTTASTTPYTASVTIDSAGCTTAVTFTNKIHVLTPPTKTAFTYTPSSQIAPGDSVHFANVNNANSWLWSFGDTASGASNNTATMMNPVHAFKDSGNYKVFVIQSIGNCTDTVAEDIHVLSPCIWPTKIPNVFTPNEDGNNDVFKVTTEGLATLNCTIFDRWGLEVYKYDAINGSWDGRTNSGQKAASGTYFYLFDATCVIGNVKKQAQGFVDLIR